MQQRMLVLICCSLAVGCQSLSSRPNKEADAVLEEIRQQPRLHQAVAEDRVDPTPILKRIPLGTPLKQAQAVMQACGFTCSLERDPGSRGLSLFCRADMEDGFLVGTTFRVKIEFQKEQVTNVKVWVGWTGL